MLSWVKEFWGKHWLSCVFALAIALFIGVIWVYWVSVPDNMKIPGDAGSFIGGISGSIFGVLTFIGLLWTIQLQRDELKLTRDELSRSAQAQEDSAKTAKEQQKLIQQQQFESTFFSFFDVHKNALDQITMIEKDDLSIAEISLCCVLTFPMPPDDESQFDSRYPHIAKYRQVADSLKSLSFNGNRKLNQYCMMLVQLFHFIDSAPEGLDTEKYIGIVKASIPNEVLLVIMYSCFFYKIESDKRRKESWRQYEQLFNYVEKFTIFESIDLSYRFRIGLIVMVENDYFSNDELSSTHIIKILNVYSSAFGGSYQLEYYLDQYICTDYPISKQVLDINKGSYIDQWNSNKR